MIVFVILRTIREVAINPNITRIWLSVAESGQKNVAGYYFTFAIPVIVVLCAMLFQKTKNVLLKVAMVLVAAFLLYFLFVAQYTLSILLAFIGVAVSLMVNTTNRFKTLMIIGVMVVACLVPVLLKLVIAYVESEQISSRLNELYLFLTSGDLSTNNLGGRMELYGKTLSAFFRSPIWGNRSVDFDGHATFLTVLSDIGLLGAIPYYFLYFVCKKQTDGLVGSKNYWPIFTVILIGGLLNPIHSALPLMFVVWFLAPLSIDFIYNKE